MHRPAADWTRDLNARVGCIVGFKVLLKQSPGQRVAQFAGPLFALGESNQARRFGLGRVVFVGDRGMVSAKNLKELDGDGHGYLVGLRRRNNPKVDAWLQQVDERAWSDCPGGINARERQQPLRTRVQEVVMAGEDEPSAPDDKEQSQRVFVIHSDERQAYEQAQRNKSMQRTLEKLRKLKKRVDGGSLSDPEKIGASAARAMAAHHGGRYYRWEVKEGKFHFEEDAGRLGAEKRLEGKYVIAT